MRMLSLARGLRRGPLFASGAALGLALVSPADADAAIIATRRTATPYAGVQTIEGTTRAPASTYHAVVVSLCTAGVRLDATKAPTSFVTVPAWAQSSGAEVVVNGDFFAPGPRVYGLAVGSGAAWPVARTGADPAVKSEWYYDRFGWIALGKGWVEFSHTEAVKTKAAALGVREGWKPTQVTHDFPAGTVALVSGFPELVTEGKRVTCSSPTVASCFADRTDMRTRNPRTAMGLSRDRRKLVLAVVDGRTARSAGMYGTELAELMEELGAWQAFNLDGGGSSEMWVRGRGTVSAPSDGASRAVANHWGVFVEAGKAAAHCQPLPADAGADAARDGGADGGEDGGEGADDPSDPGLAPGPVPTEAATPPGADVAPGGDDGAPSADEGCATGGGGGAGTGAAALGLGAVAVALGRRARARRRT